MIRQKAETPRRFGWRSICLVRGGDGDASTYIHSTIHSMGVIRCVPPIYQCSYETGPSYYLPLKLLG